MADVIDCCPITGFGVLCTPEECVNTDDCEPRRRMRLKEADSPLEQKEKKNERKKRLGDN